jgi:hypothetical protein
VTLPSIPTAFSALAMSASVNVGFLLPSPLENDQGVLVGDDRLKNHITNYYKDLFGPQRTQISP